MAELNIQGSTWPMVQVGRVVLLKDEHKDGGKLATIVEIIDHKRVSWATLLMDRAGRPMEIIESIVN
jgi:ribosomal protein L14E/L6E/L27E